MPEFPYQPASRTSQAAATRIRPTAATLRQQVYEFILACGERGATDEQIAIGLDLNPSSARPRRIELVEAGEVCDSGLTRNTRSGRSAAVWRATRKEYQQELW